jgi:hypothetical protein
MPKTRRVCNDRNENTPTGKTGTKMAKHERAEEGVAAGDPSDALRAVADRLGVDWRTVPGWDATSARLFAIDCALVVYRNCLPDLRDQAQGQIYRSLIESRRLVVAEREVELGAIENALVTGLQAASAADRQVWLVALNAIIPDPLRAALAAVDAACSVEGPASRRESVHGSLCERLGSDPEEMVTTDVPSGLRELRIAVA